MENNLRTQIQNEALKRLIPNKCAGVAISMGVGKTRLGIRHMLNLRHLMLFTKFLVVVPKRTIIDSWKDEIKLMGHDDLIDQITFTTYRSLPKAELGYDVIYLDECHSLLPSHSDYLNKHQGRIVGLTGTPPRFAEGDKGQLVARYCPIIYTYLTNDAVDSHILNDYRIFIHRIPLSTSQTLRMESKNGGVWYTSEQDSYDYWTKIYDESMGPDRMKASIMRMQAMMKFNSKEEYLKTIMYLNTGKTLIFANNKAQADRVCTHSYYSGNPNNKENLKLFKEGKIQTLSCVHQLSQGVNIPNLKYGVIMHAFGNERTAAQRFGRMLRLSTNETSYVHVLTYQNTVDELWVERALEDFDQDKIYDFDPELMLC